MKVGFVGLGNMGEAIASNVLKSGHELTVFNRTASKCAELERNGARVAKHVEELTASEVLISMLSDDSALEAVDAAVFDSLDSSTIHVSMSTVSAKLMKKLSAKYTEARKFLVSCPVFGRPPVARAAQLVILASGPASAIEKIKPVIEPLGRKLVIVGDEPEQATLIKLGGNFMIASILEGLGETCALVEKAGVNKEEFLNLICEDVFQSPRMKSYGEIIANERYSPAGFPMELGLKDLRLVLAAGDDLQVPMPFASIIRDNFISGLARGKGQLDWSALAQVAKENAGL